MSMLGSGEESQLMFSSNNNITDEDVIDIVYQWNIRHPLDRWWREKHKIAFNSEAHRRVSFLDIRFEFEEDRIMKKVMEGSKYTPNVGDWLIIPDNLDDNLTEEQRFTKYKKEFNSIDLSQYDD